MIIQVCKSTLNILKSVKKAINYVTRLVWPYRVNIYLHISCKLIIFILKMKNVPNRHYQRKKQNQNFFPRKWSSISPHRKTTVRSTSEWPRRRWGSSRAQLADPEDRWRGFSRRNRFSDCLSCFSSGRQSRWSAPLARGAGAHWRRRSRPPNSRAILHD